jgi:hypothetical protein
VDREAKFEGSELTSSVISFDGFTFILDDSEEAVGSTAAECPDEEPLTSECDFLWPAPFFCCDPFDCVVETGTFPFGLFGALALSSSAGLSSPTVTLSLALLSSTLFSHGRAAIHLSNHFCPH